jgi:predicted nucleic acid-binding Zn ribbon protein
LLADILFAVSPASELCRVAALMSAGTRRRLAMNGLIYLVGLVVVVLAVLSFFGLR